MRYRKAVLVVASVLLLGACTWQQQQRENHQEEAEKAAAEVPPLCLGAVHQVYPEQNFVLVRVIGPMPSAGTTLVTHPPDGSVSRLGNICVTSEKPTRNGIIAADVRAGTVLRGDRVFLYRDISTHEPKEEETDADNAEVQSTDAPPAPVGVADTPENEHPRIINTPVIAQDAEIPDPVSSDTGDDTSVEQMPEAGSAQDGNSVPLPSGGPGASPSYLDEIPDNINGWN